MENSRNKNFVAYEYKEITVDLDQASLYLDAYENFGWEADEKMDSSTARGKAKLHFRRDRKILNKAELTRLQRNFDACMEEIHALEASKTSAAIAVSIATGIVGTGFIAGSVFDVTAATPMITLGIVLAIPGFIGWALPNIIFKKMVRSRTEKVTPLIDAKYDELYEVCEKGGKLLQ